LDTISYNIAYNNIIIAYNLIIYYFLNTRICRFYHWLCYSYTIHIHNHSGYYNLCWVCRDKYSWTFRVSLSQFLKLSYIATDTTIFNLSSLKQLILCDCRFECGMGDSLNLFEECVNLQYLYFHSCVYYGDVKNFIIYVSQLIPLDISGFRVDEMFDEDCELVTPMFKYFKYHDSNLYSFSSEIDLNFVEKIDMDVRWETSYTHHGVFEEILIHCIIWSSYLKYFDK